MPSIRIVFPYSLHIPCIGPNQDWQVNLAIKALRATSFSSLLFLCQIVNDYIIPKATETWKLLSHKVVIKVSLEKNAFATSVLDILCILSLFLIR